jgi:hypothetical protein
MTVTALNTLAELSAALAPALDGTLATCLPKTFEDLGIKKSLGYLEIKAGRLRVIKIGKRTLVTAGERRRYVSMLEAEAEARRLAAAATDQNVEAVATPPAQAPASPLNPGPGAPVLSARAAAGGDPGDATGNDVKAA